MVVTNPKPKPKSFFTTTNVQPYSQVNHGPMGSTRIHMLISFVTAINTQIGLSVFSRCFFTFIVKKKNLNNSVASQHLSNIFFALICFGLYRSPETQEFMNIVFCLPIGQGYGATEARWSDARQS
jgi:hypothetical protein